MKQAAKVFARLSLLALFAGLAVILYRQTPPEEPPLTAPIDRILIEKSARKMTVFRDGVALKTYRIALGFAPVGDKVRQGDGRTPEGVFRINRRNPNSAFHLSLGLDYPQPEDIARAEAGGYSPGGDIFIHGQQNGRGAITLAYDWTAGCIAVSDKEIQELWEFTPIGTEVEIRP
ncbi:MAG: hypothetical protein CR993_05640 [Rhodobacterales bacterium]|nr:MAG: hypothetical protein CR993_05640 [Rhodobacterales bacterium]